MERSDLVGSVLRRRAFLPWSLRVVAHDDIAIVPPGLILCLSPLTRGDGSALPDWAIAHWIGHRDTSRHTSTHVGWIGDTSREMGSEKRLNLRTYGSPSFH